MGDRKKPMKKMNVPNPKIGLIVLIIFLFSPCLCAQEAQKPAAKPESQTNLITLDLKDIDLKDALKVISQASGLNVIIDNDVRARVTITLKDVSWQTALDNILKINQLTYRIKDNIIRVMTLESVKKEEDTVPLATKIITPNFAKADDVLTSVGKMLSTRGSIQVNQATNSLVIADTPEVISRIENLVDTLDIRTPQVMIEALIISVNLTDIEEYGLDWTSTHKDHSASPNLRQFKSLLGPGDSIVGTAMAISYGKTILPNWNFQATLNLFAEDKRVKILASPRVLTLDNQTAQIEILEQVAYTYVAQSTETSGTVLSTTQFKDTGIKLYVTPHITKDKFISMQVKAEQSFVSGYTNNQPGIDTRKVDTNFMLKDSEAIVIGGLKKKSSTLTYDKIPLLGDIPFFGNFFRNKVKTVTDTELLIFISPHIIENVTLTKKEEAKLKKASLELTSPKTIEASPKVNIEKKKTVAAPKKEEAKKAPEPSVPAPRPLTKKEKKALRDKMIAETLNKVSVSSTVK